MTEKLSGREICFSLKLIILNIFEDLQSDPEQGRGLRGPAGVVGLKPTDG